MMKLFRASPISTSSSWQIKNIRDGAEFVSCVCGQPFSVSNPNSDRRCQLFYQFLVVSCLLICWVDLMLFSPFHLLSFSSPHHPLVSSSLCLSSQSFWLLVLSTLRRMQTNICLPPPHIWTICTTCGELNKRWWNSALWWPYYFDTWHTTSWIRAQLETMCSSECRNVAKWGLLGQILCLTRCGSC
jgi:hypothetical protein